MKRFVRDIWEIYGWGRDQRNFDVQSDRGQRAIIERSHYLANQANNNLMDARGVVPPIYGRRRIALVWCLLGREYMYVDNSKGNLPVKGLPKVYRDGTN